MIKSNRKLHQKQAYNEQKVEVICLHGGPCSIERLIELTEVNCIGENASLTLRQEFRDYINTFRLIQTSYVKTGGFKNLHMFYKSLSNPSEFRFILYFSLPPNMYAQTCKNLAETFDEPLRKNFSLILEKPFGYSYQSAEALNASIVEHFKEEQIYRIDHYLCKMAVKNILAVR